MGSSIVPINTKFLVTSDPRYELDAASEVWHCLYVSNISNEIDIVFIRTRKKGIRGLFGVIFNEDALKAIRTIRTYLLKKPWILRYTHRIIPIEIVSTKLDDIVDFISKVGPIRIGDGKWCVRVSKHSSGASSRRIIDLIAKHIHYGEVSLEKPDWIINIEIIVDTYLASVITPSDIIRKKTLWEELNKKRLLEYL